MTAPRRPFKLGLRTMFVAMAIAACWLGYHVKWIRERHVLLAEQQAMLQFCPTYITGVTSDLIEPLRVPTSLLLLPPFGNSNVQEVYVFYEFDDRLGLLRGDELINVLFLNWLGRDGLSQKQNSSLFL
jgi:hypothetical protein